MAAKKQQKTTKTIPMEKPMLKPATVYKPKSDEWHRKIARNRGESWKRNVDAGRRDARLNPSNLAIARLNARLLQFDISQQLDMSESAYGAIERGHQKVKEPVARQISKILGVPIKKLFSPVEKQKFVAIIRKQNI